MLGKLLKYEIKSTARIFLPIYGLIIALALLNKVFISNNSFSYAENYNQGLKIAATISMMTYVAFIVALFVVTLVMLIRRFYRNLLGDEGYLSFTLPVKVHSHIDAKLITTFMWEVLSLIVSAFSIFIMTINSSTVQGFSKFCMEVSNLFATSGAIASQLLIEIIIILIASIMLCTLQIYASIVIGNLSSKHKMLAGFGAFVGFGIVQQIISSTVFNNIIYNFTFSMNHGASTIASLYAIRSFLLALIIFDLIFSVIFYFITDWMLQKKLNLE